MKVLCVLIVVAGSVFYVSGANSTATAKFESFIYERCNRNSLDASSYDSIKGHLQQFTDYLSYSISLLPIGKEQFCKDERRQLVGLMRELSGEFYPCLGRNERFLSRFINESFVGFLRFLCVNDGKNIDNYFSTQGRDCRENLVKGNAKEDVQICFKKLFNRFDDEIRKEDLCYDIKSTHTCFGEALAKHCSGFRAFGALTDNFFNSILTPCTTAPDSAVAVGAQGLLLTFFALLLTKIIT